MKISDENISIHVGLNWTHTCSLSFYHSLHSKLGILKVLIGKDVFNRGWGPSSSPLILSIFHHSRALQNYFMIFLTLFLAHRHIPQMKKAPVLLKSVTKFPPPSVQSGLALLPSPSLGFTWCVWCGWYLQRQKYCQITPLWQGGLSFTGPSPHPRKRLLHLLDMI